MNRFLLTGAALLVTTVLAAGCSYSKSASDPQPSASPTAGSLAVSPQPAELSSASPISSSDAASAELQGTQLGDAKTTQSLGNSGKPAESPPASDMPEAGPGYSREHPLLVGIALGEAKQTVRSRLGDPTNTYTLDGESVSVDDYGTFSVGYEADGGVLFVDVGSAEIDPGLNGLRLGQKADDAELKLGQPDSSTAYVLSYQTKNTVLKLDLDPKTKWIVSIKLFGVQE